MRLTPTLATVTLSVAALALPLAACATVPPQPGDVAFIAPNIAFRVPSPTLLGQVVAVVKVSAKVQSALHVVDYAHEEPGHRRGL